MKPTPLASMSRVNRSQGAASAGSLNSFSSARTRYGVRERSRRSTESSCVELPVIVFAATGALWPASSADRIRSTSAGHNSSATRIDTFAAGLLDVPRRRRGGWFVSDNKVLHSFDNAALEARSPHTLRGERTRRLLEMYDSRERGDKSGGRESPMVR